MTRIHLTVNGREIEAEVSPRTHLADFLREQLLLTGTHIGCEHGICGACTVEIDGEISRSCITYAVACDGAKVRTIEGFDDDALMEKMRQAFKQHHALQCGYCTPGMLVAARDLVRRKSNLDRTQIRTEMSGNLCRCTGYVGIVSAIETVMRTEAAGSPVRLENAWLGPAPGPGAGAKQDAAPVPAKAAAAPGTRAAVPAIAALSNRPPIAVHVGEIRSIDGTTYLSQSFTLPHAPATVWSLMSDPPSVAACIPGLSLDAMQEDGTWPGRMEVALGPIKASFAGLGTVQSLPADLRQIISGRGGDKRSGSQASGSVDYSLIAEDADATRVDVVISYVLAGPLAQVGRSGIVRDLVRRMAETFARNLDIRLHGGEVVPQEPLSGVSLMLQLVRDRLVALWQVLFGRRG